MAQIPLGNGFYYDTDTGETVSTTGGGYFGDGTSTGIDPTKTDPTKQPAPYEFNGQTYNSEAELNAAALKYDADQRAAGNKALAAANLQVANINAGAIQSQIAAQQSMYAAQQSQGKREARSTLEAWLTTFFDSVGDADTIRSMMSFVDQQILSDVPSDAIKLNLRQQKFYQDRFKGNEALRAAGMAELDPSQYLYYEKSAAEYLKSAGLSDLANRNNFATLIGGQVSLPELQDRVTNVYLRIKNADSALRDEMNRLGELGNLTSSDFAGALLMGKDGADLLKRKIQTAEVSTEFTARGLTSQLGASELAGMGVSREQARQGAEYAQVGTQRLAALADIYGQTQQGIQSELESEAFKGLASQRRKSLVAAEQSAFAGSSGMGTPSLGKQSIGTF